MPTLTETKVETRRFVFPGESNASMTAHGGDLVKWMEQTGGMSAMRFAGSDVLTVGMDGVRFHRPIPQGSIALFDAYVYDSGATSVRARVRGYDENRHTAERTLATEALMTLVAVDDDGETVAVPDLTVETDEGERLRGDATDDRSE
jgi:acyl-CoA hydrolase